jgi:hypothetical protein
MRRTAVVGVLMITLTGGALGSAGQQGVGQTPSPLPLSLTIRERGSSVTPAYEGWYYDKDGNIRLLVGYFNRNTKQEFDIPVGPNNHVDPGGPDQGQPTHFQTGRQWGVFAVKVPKEFGDKKLTWTIVTNGFTNSITLHTKAEYVVEPFEDAANKNTPPKIQFQPDGPVFTGPPTSVAATYTASMANPLTLTTWVTDEGPKINVPEAPPGRGRGRGRGRGDAAAFPEFQPPPPLAVKWALFRGPAAVKFDPAAPPIDKENGGKTTTTATFSAPGEYVLRVQANDSTGEGGGGFQCCWSNAYVKVTVSAATR